MVRWMVQNGLQDYLKNEIRWFEDATFLSPLFLSFVLVAFKSDRIDGKSSERKVNA